MLRGLVQWLSGRNKYAELADASDAYARKNAIDPPRPGRKTYAQRMAETRRLSTEEIDATIAQRIKDGKGDLCGILYRVRSERI